MEIKREVITITLPADMIKELRELASLNKRTLSATIEMFIELELNNMKEDN